ncbi:MAG: alpha/beta fold hydrolase [Myxococcales bacterium]|nr:alpha/beta fold hydrolase [Myxococcales bacterium]
MRFAPFASSWLLLPILVCGCGDDDAPTEDGGADAMVAEEDAATRDAGPTFPTTIGGDRPAQVVLPREYDGAPAPLIVLLHGFGASGSAQDLYLGLSRTARTRGVITVVPDGTLNTMGQRFWNATDACCLFGDTPVDDVAYITGLVEEAKEVYAIDEDRVYLFGHSNGGFMSYRLACDAPEPFAALVSLAGATFIEEERCTPSQALSVLQVHGTADTTILYEGGRIGGAPYPSVAATMARAAAIAGCQDTPEVRDRFDFNPMNEAEESVYPGCDEGRDVRLWTIEEGSHIPGWGAGTMDRLLDWLLDRRR